MIRLILPAYLGIVLYVWFNAISEFIFSEGNFGMKLNRFAGKVFFAPLWFMCVFSAQGREYLFNWTKGANL